MENTVQHQIVDILKQHIKKSELNPKPKPTVSKKKEAMKELKGIMTRHLDRDLVGPLAGSLSWILLAEEINSESLNVEVRKCYIEAAKVIKEAADKFLAFANIPVNQRT